MTLATGARLGAYEILGPLGAGGMGEVYRARDTKLDRDVALKSLPALFAVDPDRLMRFEREAKTLAALNHPNVAQIHGIEDAGSVRALVMELVEGEDLARLIARGPMPPEHAIGIARQIAAALEAAHEAGIIHRDLKPANVKVREDGTVKVLDFGLAKALDPGSSRDGLCHTNGVAEGISPAQSPTFTSPALTQMGVILGTAAYMAPEQARGKSVDKRADIWAFGCVLYEMLTGRAVFAGETLTDTLAAIMTRDADLQALPATTPAAVRRLLARCLERDPKQRLRDIGEARIALEAPALPGDAGPVAASSRLGTPVWIAVLVVVAAAAAFAGWRLNAPSEPPVRRHTIPTPRDAPPFTAAVSPVGNAIAFVAAERVWLQWLNAFAPVEVPGSDGAHAVFWSPDGTQVGFEARGQLWRASVAGGAPLAIGHVPQAFTAAGGAAWLEDGRIVFTTGGSGLLVIPATGGEPAPLLEIAPNADADFHNASGLPGGRGVLFVRHPAVETEPLSLELYVPAERRRQVLHVPRNSLSRPVYAASGHILFEQDGGVWMLPFSIERLEATAPPSLVVADAREPSIARDGTLVMLPGDQSGVDARLTWIDRYGSTSSVLGQAGSSMRHPRISPDGRFVAATAGTSGDTDVWVIDAARGTDRRLSFDSGPDVLPSWTPDSRHVVYHCGTGICAQRADGSGGRVELIGSTIPVSPPVISPDGKWLVFVRETQPSDGDLWMVELGPDGPVAPVTATPRPLMRSARLQRHPDISPDGRFIAYVSAESGTFSAYVSRFPDGDGKWQVSGSFGAWPRWSPKRNRLYFHDEFRRIAEMEVDLTTTFQPGPILARVPALGFGQGGFDVDAGGERFLIPRSPGGELRSASLLVVQNWRP
ncbi:MAG TPA: protein kinase [Vicinamibacterales bacterium]|nr:protein kinase [Vicinamibacterales bacterium]